MEIRVGLVCVAAMALLVAGISWRTHWLDYEVFVPASDAQKTLPALIILHGRSGDAQVMRRWLGIETFAQRHGFIVIYPQSHQDGWDFGVGIRERGNVRRRYIDHTRYILNVIDRVNDSYPIDRSRLFVAGVSDGASMAVRMSCVEPEIFRGLISIAATIPFYAVQDCNEAAPLSVLLMHGVEDTVMPWEGSVYKQYRVFLSFEESIVWWMTRNRCHEVSVEQHDFEYLRGEVDVLRVEDCRDDTQVIAYRVNDGGHTWPGHDHPQKRTRGYVNQDIDASLIVSDWIMQFRIDMSVQAASKETAAAH